MTFKPISFVVSTSFLQQPPNVACCAWGLFDRHLPSACCVPKAAGRGHRACVLASLKKVTLEMKGTVGCAWEGG